MFTQKNHNHALGQELHEDHKHDIPAYKEVVAKSKDFLMKNFPDIYDESLHVLERLEEMKRQRKERKSRVVQRSLSLGSPRRFKLQRFRVKTPNVILVTRPEGQGGQFSNQTNGSKDIISGS
ncbi:unnamed protein product [Cuscuta epithymum]|uniref:Uncharacterized protein n=1 Tax=Cuscuta epithymum TaxID=186058 RepID=A0AAV0EHS3_9ASTE|nr:unnamed protein product [Cuscuta epithymum]